MLFKEYKPVSVEILTEKPLYTEDSSDLNVKMRDALVDVIGLGIVSPHSLAIIELVDPS